MPITPSPLRYPGGKAKFYSYIRGILAMNDLLGETYIEPFAGGAGLALKLLLNNDVRQIVINDFDYAIYSFWYSILNHTEEFCELIELTDITPSEWYRQREIYLEQSKKTKLEIGFATFFLNRTNVSGIIKGGMIGGKNQRGTYVLNARFNKKNLIKRINAIAKRREQIILYNMDALQMIRANYFSRFGSSFINFDPPYVNKGHQLYKNSYTEEDHKELSHSIGTLTDQRWIVTYDVNPLVKTLYEVYRHSYLDVNYSVNRNRKAKEIIFFSDSLCLPNYIEVL